MTPSPLRLATALGVILLSASARVDAQSGASALEGAWAVQETSYAKPTDVPVSRPTGLIVFSGQRYAAVILDDTTRPELAAAEVDAASANLLRAVYGPLEGNAGAFVVSGSTLTLRPAVAKNTFPMAPGFFLEHTFTLDGDTLVLTRTRTSLGPTDNALTRRFTRVR